MNIEEVFLLQFVLSLVVISLLAKWHATPLLAEKPLQLVLIALIVPHTFRHVGMAFIVPILNQPNMPLGFAIPAAYGDLLSGLLALLALIALRGQWAMAIPIVWIFSVVGIIDLAHALRQAGAIQFMGATWFIPTFLVPLLVVTHVMIITRLIRYAKHMKNPIQTI